MECCKAFLFVFTNGKMNYNIFYLHFYGSLSTT